MEKIRKEKVEVAGKAGARRKAEREKEKKESTWQMGVGEVVGLWPPDLPFLFKIVQNPNQSRVEHIYPN
jgi:hypothetical protein